MSKELKEDGVFYHQSSPKSISTRNRKTAVVIYKAPVLTKLDSFGSTMKVGKGVNFSQTRNINTGHWIKRDEISGELTVGIGTKSFPGVPVRRKFRAAANPSISKETAEMAEKAVLATLNRSLKK